MSKKGFTLIELLAIIVLIGVIALIAVPNITREIQSNEDQTQTLNEKKIEYASKMYAAKYYAKEIIEGKEIKFSFADMEADGLINLDNMDISDKNKKRYYPQDFVTYYYLKDGNEYIKRSNLDTTTSEWGEGFYIGTAKNHTESFEVTFKDNGSYIIILSKPIEYNNKYYDNLRLDVSGGKDNIGNDDAIPQFFSDVTCKKTCATNKPYYNYYDGGDNQEWHIKKIDGKIIIYISKDDNNFYLKHLDNGTVRFVGSEQAATKFTLEKVPSNW